MITSPLRYPGGKAKLFPFFAELIRHNKLFGCDYCEPYAGGAGLAIKLLTNGFVDRIAINDIDQSIYSFWFSALFNTDKFCRMIDKTPVTIDQWHRQHEIWNEADFDNKLKLGFSAFFLNRTNRSGIIEGAGPIGGYAQKSQWKVDVRLSKQKQIENLKALSRFSAQISITNLDAFNFIGRKIKNRNNLLYLDPPYFVKGKKLYKNFYEEQDHFKIAQYLEKNRKANWVVSYDDVSEIRKAYRSFIPITYLLNYSAGEKSLGAEVIFLSDTIKNPRVSGFDAHHSRRVVDSRKANRPKSNRGTQQASRQKPHKSRG